MSKRWYSVGLEITAAPFTGVNVASSNISGATLQDFFFSVFCSDVGSQPLNVQWANCIVQVGLPGEKISDPFPVSGAGPGAVVDNGESIGMFQNTYYSNLGIQLSRNSISFSITIVPPAGVTFLQTLISFSVSE